MIRITPLEQRADYDAILELYFYLVARATPFCPEDIFPNNIFHEKGDIQRCSYPVESFYRKSGKRPRQRKPNYKKLLKCYGIQESSSPSQDERRINDALLAKQIIKQAFVGVSADKSLYDFLYSGLPQNDIHVHKDRLHLLLMSYMDSESLRQANLCFESSACQKLDEVFRYKEVFAKEAVQLMSLLGTSVCPYCNRNFTTTVTGPDGIRQGQFDHYHPKSVYPWFALSLLNLVPSCGFCNHNKKDMQEHVLYPYKEGMDRYYRFRTRPVHGISYLTGAPMTFDEFEVEGEYGPMQAAPGFVNRIQMSLKHFHLSKLYKTHQEHIAWIFRQRYVFSNAYLAQLCQTFPTLFSSIQDARDMLYMRHISPEHWGEHPLSKLTHDIDEEITELENYFTIVEKQL